MVLLRHLVGDALRRLRLRQGRTLREVSASARVSLGYLSEVERGQKEASSELLAAICSALGAPLSQVLREVSDNFALAELQSEPVFADVIEPGIEVAGVSHGAGSRHDGELGEPDEVPVAPVGSDPVPAPAADRVPAGAGARLRSGANQLGSGQIGSARVAHGTFTQKMTVPGAMPISANLTAGDPPYDRVARTVHEITNMVPV